MIEENRAKFFTVSWWVPLEQGLPQGYKGLIVISLSAYLVSKTLLSFESFDLPLPFPIGAHYG